MRFFGCRRRTEKMCGIIFKYTGLEYGGGGELDGVWN